MGGMGELRGPGYLEKPELKEGEEDLEEERSGEGLEERRKGGGVCLDLICYYVFLVSIW